MTEQTAATTEQTAATGTAAPVRCAVTVPLSPDRAFALFTDGYHTWWPGHHIGTADLAEAVLEPDRQTRVELEHRHIERHGAGAAGIRQGVSGPGGWAGILEGYAKIAAA